MKENIGSSMQLTPDLETEKNPVIWGRHFELLVIVIAALVMLTGCTVLVGWICDISALKRISVNWASMKTNTAFCLLICGIVLLILKQNYRGVNIGLSIILLIAIITLCEYIFTSNLKIDELIFKDTPTISSTGAPGRMSPITAVNLILIVFSFFFFKKNYLLSQSFALVVIITSFYGLLGYYYGVQELTGFATFTKMALHTSICFLLLAIGILLSQKEKGFTMLLLSDNSAGVMFRRLLPIAILLPLILGWLTLLGKTSGWYYMEFGIALLSTSTIVLLVIAIWWNAGTLYKAALKRKKSKELISAFKELAFQNEEKEEQAAELFTVNEKLIYQSEEKEKRAAELVIANKELAFQNEEKEKRAAELVIANKELLFQNDEKEKRAAELVIANKELLYQNDEKEKRAAELVIANKELLYQNDEKENRAAELLIANKELVFQYNEKEKRAAELVVANDELAFQNNEKEKRAAELVVANKELAFQNEEKEKRAAELIISNEELKKAEYHIVELNIGLEQKIVERTAQLEAANNELESFSYSVSHDLRAPLRAINGFTQVLIEDYMAQLDDDAKAVLNEIINNSRQMGELVDNLLEFARIGKQNVLMGNVVMNELVNSVITELKQEEPDRKIKITVKDMGNIKGDKNMLKQVFINLISNSFKYTGKKEEAVIEIGSDCDEKFCTYYIKDNGAGFDMQYYDKLFGVFQRLHSNNEFEGTGVGLAIIQRIVTKHGGKVWAEGKVNEGAKFYVSLPLTKSN